MGLALESRGSHDARLHGRDIAACRLETPSGPSGTPTADVRSVVNAVNVPARQFVLCVVGVLVMSSCAGGDDSAVEPVDVVETSDSVTADPAEGVFVPTEEGPGSDPTGSLGTGATDPDTSSASAATDDDPLDDASRADGGTVAEAVIDQSDVAEVLVPAESIGLPPDWVLSDSGPASPSGDALALGAFPCPVDLSQTNDWLGRRFSAPIEPVESGIVEVEVLAAAQDDEQYRQQLTAFDDCPVAEFTDVGSTGREFRRGDGVRVVSTTYSLVVGPSASIGFPSRHSIVLSHAAGRTILVVVSGIDFGQAHDVRAEQIADELISG